MIECPDCGAEITLIAPAAMTPEQLMYLRLFDVLLDREATPAVKRRARAIMDKLDMPARRARPVQSSGLLGDLIREALSDRIDG